MIDFEGMRLIVAKGLRDYCKCPVVRTNQNEAPPAYPYISYTVTMPMNENKGTYGKYEDGTERKPFTQTWSISALSNNDAESVRLACMAREWLDRVGTLYLTENNVIVESVGSVTNRDNFLTVEYEHKNGFDAFFTVEDVIESVEEQEGYIETTEIGGINVDKEPTVDELSDMLEKRLDGEVM